MTTTIDAEPSDPFTPPASATRSSTPDGEFFVWMPRPGLIAEKAIGVYSLPMVESVAGACRLVFGDPNTRFDIFIDVEQVGRYTRDARDAMTSFTLEYRDSIASVHILLASRTIALGVSAYKHVVGDALVHTYADRGSFLRSFAAALVGSPVNG